MTFRRVSLELSVIRGISRSLPAVPSANGGSAVIHFDDLQTFFVTRRKIFGRNR